MRNLGMKALADQIGNIFAIRPRQQDLLPVMTGSHIDTVYNGRNLDSNPGVLAGLEFVATLNEN